MTRSDGHPSDDPGTGRGAGPEIAGERERHPSSGASAPSPPRRPGTGQRQAPRRHEVDDLASLPVIPGEICYGDDPVVINAGADVTVLQVVNAADRPIQVGSHYHFAEVNAGLEFDRDAAWGLRLNVLSGGAMRFEPGTSQRVELIPIRGRRIVAGLRGLCGGELDRGRQQT